jgi:hypothetical protein
MQTYEDEFYWFLFEMKQKDKTCSQLHILSDNYLSLMIIQYIYFSSCKKRKDETKNEFYFPLSNLE